MDGWMDDDDGWMDGNAASCVLYTYNVSWEAVVDFVGIVINCVPGDLTFHL
jgi:hypothetical protein